jgi:hypothetical protein
MKQEANHAYNEKLWAWKQKRYAMSVARMAAQERGEDMPTKPESLDKEKEEEGEIIPPPLSLSRKTLPSFSDIISRQVGIPFCVRQPKWTWTGTGPSAGLP